MDRTEPRSLSPATSQAPGDTLSRLSLAAAVGASALLVLLWLLDVSGHGLPRLVSQLVTVVCDLFWGLTIALWLLASWRRERWQGLVLPGLLVLSVVVRFIGLGREAGEGYYGDEGIYWQAAQNINAGDLLPRSFIYGHLLYYLAAFALWIQACFPGTTASLAHLVYGSETDAQITFVVLRSVSATLGALTTVPVYLVARRLGGGLAGVVGALLIVFSPLYNEVTHLLISDVPSAFFATLCLYFTARLVDRESAPDYLWAGVCAGLAAASKWPAGVVAVAIVAGWFSWRIRERNWSWWLLGSGLVSVATVLVVMPAFLFGSGNAFANEGRDIFFGFRQYGSSGWIGVVRESNTLYYGNLLVQSFGWPAIGLGVLGCALLPGKTQRRLAWNLVYPIVFLGLMMAMAMAVKRNLLPLVPILAALLGVGISGWQKPLRSAPRFAAPAVAVIALLVLALPVRSTVEQEMSMIRVGTRALAVEWIHDNVPAGATFVKESYTPKLDPAHYVSLQGRFVARRELDDIRSPANDFLLLAWNAYGRFTRPENLTKPHHHIIAERYRKIFTWEKVRDFDPGRTRSGPFMTLYRLHPPSTRYASELEFDARDTAFLNGAKLDDREAPGRVLFDGEGQWALFKSYVAAGCYEIALATDGRGTGPAVVRVITRDNAPLARLDLSAPEPDSSFRVERKDKLFFYVELPPGSSLVSLRLTPRPT